MNGTGKISFPSVAVDTKVTKMNATTKVGWRLAANLALSVLLLSAAYICLWSFWGIFRGYTLLVYHGNLREALANDWGSVVLHFGVLLVLVWAMIRVWVRKA